MDFYLPTLEDKAFCDRCFAQADYAGSNFNFSTIYLWQDAFRQEIAKTEDGLCIFRHKASDGMIFYAMPTGHGDLKAAIDRLLADAQRSGQPFQMLGVPNEGVKTLQALYPGQFAFTAKRSMADYMYTAEQLATLAGKKLHAKRNHINKFINCNEDWAFEPLSPQNLDACKQMAARWFAQQTEPPASLAQERLALDRAFGQFGPLGLTGGCLRSGGQVIAFTIGEQLNSNTFLIHFEKAYRDYDGAYAMINREFVRYILAQNHRIEFINREEDMGLEGLRQAKLSYRPAFLYEKNRAVYVGG